MIFKDLQRWFGNDQGMNLFNLSQRHEERRRLAYDLVGHRSAFQQFFFLF